MPGHDSVAMASVRPLRYRPAAGSCMGDLPVLDRELANLRSRWTLAGSSNPVKRLNALDRIAAPSRNVSSQLVEP